MSYFSWLRSRTSYRSPRNRSLQRPAAPRFRPRLEALEDRTLPSTYTAATVSDLIADINAANKTGGANTITLTAPTTTPYVLTTVDNTTNGVNGLPVVSGGGKKTAADNLTIVGNGDTIERSSASGTPAIRLFDVASKSSLLLENVTLQNGLAFGSGTAADGGAIYNQGTLTLSGATVQNNVAQGNNGANGAITSSTKKAPNINGQAGADAAGGGIWSSGTVTLEGSSSLQGNKALGGQGGAGGWQHVNGKYTLGNGGAGGGGFGGGLYEAGGNVNATDATLSTNTAQGGAGGEITFAGFVTTPAAAGDGGAGSGGGLYVAGGTLDMMGNPQNSTLVTVESNKALGGDVGKVVIYYTPGQGGEGSGGGISLADTKTATLSYVELLKNTAQGGNGSSTAGRHRAGAGGSAFGGGLYVANGSVTLTNDTVNSNDAIGGFGTVPVRGGGTGGSGSRGFATASGGGIYIAGGTVSLDSYTVANTTGNYDDNNPFMVDNIDGPYTLI